MKVIFVSPILSVQYPILTPSNVHLSVFFNYFPISWYTKSITINGVKQQQSIIFPTKGIVSLELYGRREWFLATVSFNKK